MTIALFSICSSLHKETALPATEEAFIKDIESALGENFLFCGDDFSSFGTHDADLIYVRTGGTEGIFKSLGLKGDIRLLSSGESNSLAASMEILSYLRLQGRSGEILHGSAASIAAAIIRPLGSNDAGDCFVKPLPEIDLGGVRLGVIGAPSDWLISSGVDYDKALSRLNATLVDIPMAELLSEISLPKEQMASFEGSEEIYRALKRIVERHNLGGLTLRCFDLLDTVRNTGCLALARLNAEGIPSSCEGDIPALLTMAWLQKTGHCPGFQCNLSRIDGDELLFAHCTIPLTMVRSYSYATHFESGIGTAIKGEVPVGPARIVKISPDLEHWVSIPCEILRNQSRPNLCRTQIIVRAPGAGDYFLHRPLANHHIILF